MFKIKTKLEELLSKIGQMRNFIASLLHNQMIRYKVQAWAMLWQLLSPKLKRCRENEIYLL